MTECRECEEVVLQRLELMEDGPLREIALALGERGAVPEGRRLKAAQSLLGAPTQVREDRELRNAVRGLLERRAPNALVGAQHERERAEWMEGASLNWMPESWSARRR